MRPFTYTGSRPRSAVQHAPQRKYEGPPDPPVMSWQGPFCSVCQWPLAYAEHDALVHTGCPDRARRAAEEATRKELVQCAYCGAQALRGKLLPAERGLAHPKCRRLDK